MNNENEDNEEVTIRAPQSKNDRIEEDNNSIDEDYINDDYSKTYNQQEEIIHDNSADTSINFEEEEVDQRQNQDKEQEQEQEQDEEEEDLKLSEENSEDLQIKEDIKGLLENTIFMDDDKPTIQNDKKTTSGENLTFKDSHYSFEE